MTQEARNVAYCPHCGNKAPQRLLHRQTYLERAWAVSDGREDRHPWSMFVAVCETCGHILLYDNPADQWPDSQFSLGDLEYPKSGALHRSVPDSIAEVYEEAFRIKELAPNAFAVQIRRALEAVSEDRGARRGNLAMRLQELTDKGEIPPVLSEVSEVLRLLGNIGAHGIHESVHPMQASALDDFFRAIIEYVYVAPSKLSELKTTMERYHTARDSVDDN